MAHHRRQPSIDPGRPDSYAELVESKAAALEGGQAWAARADLRLFESPTEELADLAVEEHIGAYYRQVGVTWNGGTVLA
jgi:acetoacetate decarboxylase